MDKETKDEKTAKQQYFHLSKNEYGKMWLMYKPEGEGRYKCWEPITGEFWNEFEKLLRLELDNKVYKESLNKLVEENEDLAEQLKQERNKAIDECTKLAREYKEIIFLGESFATKLESLKIK